MGKSASIKDIFELISTSREIHKQQKKKKNKQLQNFENDILMITASKITT